MEPRTPGGDDRGTDSDGGERPTPEWLTALLSSGGYLPSGRVTAIDTLPNGAFNSAVTHLRVSYTADAPAAAPRQLVLKRNVLESWAVAAAADEVAFYRLAESQRARPPGVVRCFAAELDAGARQSTLLLEDLTATHRAPLTRDQQLTPGANVPSDADAMRVAEALAGIHAYWWDHPIRRAGGPSGHEWRADAAAFAAMIARRQEAWDALARSEGASFPADLRAIYELTLARWPERWARAVAPRLAAGPGITLTHGDAYFANFLCPRAPDGGTTYLIDWQSPGIDLGAEDLATLCATFWTPEQRRAADRETRILRRYHRTLVVAGVAGYTWEDLWMDYRLAVIDWLLVPLQDRHDGAARDYWWPKMRCLAGAFADLGCAELLTA